MNDVMLLPETPPQALHHLSGIVEMPAGRSVNSETPFKARNALTDHPLFEDERIKRLLRRVPRHDIEIRSVELHGKNTTEYKRGAIMADADPMATFERLTEKPCWMLIHNMWTHDPDYGALMREYARNLNANVSGAGEDFSDLGCWLFLSAGEIVVHFHADPDQSLLNQIRGSKTAFVYPSKILPETTVETLVYTGNQGAVTYNPAYENALFPPVHLAPGESVFLPLYAPHRVINDGGLSVSWNVGFHTRNSRRRKIIHLFNHEMRQLGWQPSPINQRPLIDRLKQHSYIAFRAKNKFFHPSEPPEIY